MGIKASWLAYSVVVCLVSGNATIANAVTSEEDAEAFEKCRKEQIEKGFPPGWTFGYCSTIPGSEVVPTMKDGDTLPAGDEVPTYNE